jgi:hypothetical protein
VDQSGDASGDPSGDGRWLTYAELATLRGISKASAERLVFRRHWRRQRGNDHSVRALVPLEFLSGDPSPDASGDGSPDISPDTSALLTGALSALEDAVTGLREQLDVANARSERAEADRADERRRAEQAEQGRDGERQRVDRAESDVRELRSHAAELQVELAERQAALDRTQAEAGAARERAAELQAGQELMMDMHARALAAAQGALDMARAQATTAHDALRTQRQAEEERRARGLLARLRAAVRGR